MEKDQLLKSEVTFEVSTVLPHPVISSSDTQTKRTDNRTKTRMEIDSSNQNSHGQKDSENPCKDASQSKELRDTCPTTETETSIVKSAPEAGNQSEGKGSSPNKELMSGMKKCLCNR